MVHNEAPRSPGCQPPVTACTPKLQRHAPCSPQHGHTASLPIQLQLSQPEARAACINALSLLLATCRQPAVGGGAAAAAHSPLPPCMLMWSCPELLCPGLAQAVQSQPVSDASMPPGPHPLRTFAPAQDHHSGHAPACSACAPVTPTASHNPIFMLPISEPNMTALSASHGSGCCGALATASPTDGCPCQLAGTLLDQARMPGSPTLSLPPFPLLPCGSARRSTSGLGTMDDIDLLAELCGLEGDEAEVEVAGLGPLAAAGLAVMHAAPWAHENAWGAGEACGLQAPCAPGAQQQQALQGDQGSQESCASSEAPDDDDWCSASSVRSHPRAPNPQRNASDAAPRDCKEAAEDARPSSGAGSAARSHQQGGGMPYVQSWLKNSMRWLVSGGPSEPACHSGTAH